MIPGRRTPISALTEIVERAELACEHEDPGTCPGIESCPAIQQMWRELRGNRPGRCMLCGQLHWPWEPHDDDAGERWRQRGKP